MKFSYYLCPLCRKLIARDGIADTLESFCEQMGVQSILLRIREHKIRPGVLESLIED